MDNSSIRLMTVQECCRSASFSRASFYRLAKADPRFPSLLKVGGLTRVRADAWRAYVESLGKRDDEVA